MLRDVLLDADETLLDYRRAEREALRQMADFFHIYFENRLLERYHTINQALWKALETGEVGRERLGTLRFERLFDECGSAADPAEANRIYIDALSRGAYLLPGAWDTCEELQKHYRLSIITNGGATTQKRRLSLSGLEQLCARCFISGEMQVQKPQREYFDAVMRSLPGARKGTSLIVGDSLTSDILGGNLSGIRTCWFNPEQKENHSTARPDFEIRHLSELPALCSGL